MWVDLDPDQGMDYDLANFHHRSKSANFFVGFRSTVFESFFERYRSMTVSNYFQRLHSDSGSAPNPSSKSNSPARKENSTIHSNFWKKCLRREWDFKLIPQDWVANKNDNLLVEMVEIKTGYFADPVNESILYIYTKTAYSGSKTTYSTSWVLLITFPICLDFVYHWYRLFSKNRLKSSN